MSFLKVSGTVLVDESGKEITLRGAGLGGWMNMENFISGYPGCEYHIREALTEAISQEKSDFFFDKFLEYFFEGNDAVFFKSLGLNCIRLPFNYRHFEDDMNPRVLKESGFKHLDRVIDICAQHGIYTILDLHTAPGGQNMDWHSDNGGHIANFWDHKDFQDRMLWLWTELAKHYKDNKWIAGYNPLNKPTDPKHTHLVKFYDEVYTTICSINLDHVIFLMWWSNTAYSIHDYSTFGFPGAPEYVGSEEQNEKMKDRYAKKQQWMDEQGLCMWNGEWGPVYARSQYDGDATDSINQVRYRVLKDQLDIYRKDSLSWSIWLYKDIGFQGMVYTSLNMPYMTLFKDFLAKKHRLAVDAWGADDTAVKHVYQPLLDHILQEVPERYQNLYPWAPSRRLARIARNILVSEFLVKEWADHFIGKSEDELDQLAKSFRFENCEKREELNAILSADATAHAA
ncbi:glycoside hydrolase family 5 protein [Gymnopilus junonius]|uniref:Glycoside hydrolase family 5 protein n=1 Tax=Gymnopilus junonius TaxID=109634 RepID=A0A9P5TKD9_GYMJU|nr:glycoside hydrolase family 5 protein [Gymnopilus junonius]